MSDLMRQSHDNKEDINYHVDLKKEQYLRNFQRIGKIFEENGGYINFIRKVKNPIIKEIYVLMRKYQNFFVRININDIDIFNFNNSDECVLDDLDKNFKESENCMKIDIYIVPKFKKNEINFPIPEDILKCEFVIKFSISNKAFSINESSNVEFVNLNSNKVLDYETYAYITKISKNLLLTYMNEHSQNFIQGVNKFITYIENYFPEIIKQSNSIIEEKKGKWSQEEQNLFESALIKYKSEKNSKEKFNKIAGEVKTKSVSECVKRYKELKELANNNKNENINNKEKEAIKNVEIKEEKKVIEKVPAISKKQLDIKKEEVIKPVIESNKTDSSELNFSNTNDLVDEILNQFNNLYSNVKFEDSIDAENKSENCVDDVEEYEDYDEELEDSFEDNKSKENEMGIDYNPNKNKNNSEDYNYNFIKNIILYGEKSSLALEGLSYHNIGLAKINELSIYLKCEKCKQIAYESKFYKLSKNSDLSYMGAVCPKCNNHMHVIFKSEYVHKSNTNYAGSLYSMNTTITDVLSTTYLINCLKCEDSYKKVNLRTGTLLHKDRNCRTCQSELFISIKSVKLSQTFNGNFSFINDLIIENFTKFNLEINDLSNSRYIKLYDRVGQVGTALPDNGTCKHYALSFRWFRFGCCGKVYPCDHCHDDIAGHNSEYAKNILCGFCSFEQSSHNIICSKCGKMFTKVSSKTGFWEGGKGTRSKYLMSNKDGHKFKNSSMKTISRKKMRDIQSKQGNK